MKNNRKNFCPVFHTLDLIGGKWKIPIISHLQSGGTLRFKELENRIEGITSRMLVKELRHLEEYNLVERKIYAEIPPKVEYTLTESGKSLKHLIREIKNWGNMNCGVEEVNK